MIEVDRELNMADCPEPDGVERRYRRGVAGDGLDRHVREAALAAFVDNVLDQKTADTRPSETFCDHHGLNFAVVVEVEQARQANDFASVDCDPTRGTDRGREVD